jgi:DNA modification methylase
MPNKNTFEIKPIKEFILENLNQGVIVDPFANINKIANITNDIDREMPTDYHMDALEFLKTLPNNYVDTVLFDPPYSPRQVSECYKKVGKTVDMKTTQSSYWTTLKKEISRIIKPGSKVITCAWNSGGIGKKYGFEIEKILLVAHGGWHNDTIVTLENKI